MATLTVQNEHGDVLQPLVVAEHVKKDDMLDVLQTRYPTVESEGFVLAGAGRTEPIQIILENLAGTEPALDEFVAYIVARIPPVLRPTPLPARLEELWLVVHGVAGAPASAVADGYDMEYHQKCVDFITNTINTSESGKAKGADLCFCQKLVFQKVSVLILIE